MVVSKEVTENIYAKRAGVKQPFHLKWFNRVFLTFNLRKDE